MSIGSRSRQIADKDRPYWIYIWQGDLSGGGQFGAAGGWVRYDGGQPGRRVDLSRERGLIECIANCTPGGTLTPIYQYNSQEIVNQIPNNDGRPPAVTAFIPQGLPGQTGIIASFFPPITVDIDCQQSPLRIEGGQIPTIYDLTLSARGFIKDFDTNEIIVPFNVSTTTRGPGPIIGYTVSQYTFGQDQRDLRSHVYYSDGVNIGDFSKPFKLSLSSLLGNSPNITIEGNRYFFDVQEVILDNLVRADGINDQCGTSACIIEFEVNYFIADDPQQTNISTRETATVQFTAARISVDGTAGEEGRSIIAYNIDNTESTIIYTAFNGSGLLPGEVITSAPLININCTYDINGQLPGCFIESPETCNVTIRDRAGILLDQTYFGRPNIETSSEYIDIQ